MSDPSFTGEPNAGAHLEGQAHVNGSADYPNTAGPPPGESGPVGEPAEDRHADVPRIGEICEGAGVKTGNLYVGQLEGWRSDTEAVLHLDGEQWAPVCASSLRRRPDLGKNGRPAGASLAHRPLGVFGWDEPPQGDPRTDVPSPSDDGEGIKSGDMVWYCDSYDQGEPLWQRGTLIDAYGENGHYGALVRPEDEPPDEAVYVPAFCVRPIAGDDPYKDSIIGQWVRIPAKVLDGAPGVGFEVKPYGDTRRFTLPASLIDFKA
jgi:hypothetical protein